MKRLFAMFGLIVLFTASTANADILLTTSTLDSADIDFDGTGMETSGNLGFSVFTYNFTPAELAGFSGFDNITSMSVTLTAVGQSVSNLSAYVGGIVEPGIGVSSPGDFSPEDVGSLGGGLAESIVFSVSSTSTNGDEVLFSGIEFNSWRNFFPVSEVSLSGATFDGGQTTLTGQDGLSGPLPIMDFDFGVDSFSVTSIGDPVRVANLRFSISSVPEPGSMSVFLALGVGAVILKRRRR